jgi:hypothetical protein
MALSDASRGWVVGVAGPDGTWRTLAVYIFVDLSVTVIVFPVTNLRFWALLLSTLTPAVIFFTILKTPSALTHIMCILRPGIASPF